MSDNGDDWVDEPLSTDLPVIRAKGEGQSVEFKESFPKNTAELGAEIAAFASTNAGIILLGVDDDGSLIGLPEAQTAKGRDTLCQRIEGICAGTVKPAITPTIRFAREKGAIILAIDVPRGSQPVYYSNDKPYVRHVRSSRPAQPHEVIDRITSQFRQGNSDQDSASRPLADFRSALARVLIGVVISGNELEQRSINPWFDMLRAQLAAYGSELRGLAATSIADDEGVTDLMVELADLLDEIANLRLAIGRESWDRLLEKTRSAFNKVELIHSSLPDILTIQDSKDAAFLRKTAIETVKQLQQLDLRATAMAESGRLSDVQSEASRLGAILSEIGHYSVPHWADIQAGSLREVGQALHLLEVERVYLDGGDSMRRILEKLRYLTNRAAEIIS